MWCALCNVHMFGTKVFAGSTMYTVLLIGASTSSVAGRRHGTIWCMYCGCTVDNWWLKFEYSFQVHY